MVSYLRLMARPHREVLLIKLMLNTDIDISFLLSSCVSVLNSDFLQKSWLDINSSMLIGAAPRERSSAMSVSSRVSSYESILRSSARSTSFASS